MTVFQCLCHTQFSSCETVILLPESIKLPLQLFFMEDQASTLILVLRKDEYTNRSTSRFAKIFRCLFSLRSSVIFQINFPATGSSPQSPRIIQACLQFSSQKEHNFNIVSQILNAYKIQIKVKWKKKDNKTLFMNKSAFVPQASQNHY